MCFEIYLNKTFKETFHLYLIPNINELQSIPINLPYGAMGEDDSADVRRTVANAWANRFEKQKESKAEHEPKPKPEAEQALIESKVEAESEPEKPQSKTKADDCEPEEPKPKKRKLASKQQDVIEILDDDDEDEVRIENNSKVPIEIESETDDEDAGPIENTTQPVKPSKPSTKEGKKIVSSSATNSSKGFPPPFLPIHNPTYDTPKLKNSLLISDLLSDPNLKSCYIFSYQHNLDFILPQFHSRDIDLKIIYQEGTVLDSEIRPLYKNIQFIKVFMQPFTSHHPKMIINFYNDKCKIYLISCNMTQLEFETNNQLVWQSPILNKTKDPKDTPFKLHLFDYLKNYDKPPLNTLCLMLKSFDFTQIIGDFVSSATSTSDKFGYLGLYKSLLYHGLIPKKYDKDRHLLYQTSSIGTAIRHSSVNNTSTNLFTHLLLPLFTGKYTDRGKLDITKLFPLPNGYQSIVTLKNEVKVQPYIIFPSLSDVRNSLFGYVSGGWSHYNPFSKWNIPMNECLTDYVFHHSYTNQRKTNPSHTKFLIMSSDNFQTLDWVFFTSANMSKQAWGAPPKKQDTYNPKSFVSNYETGVLLCPRQYGSGVKFIPLEIGEEREMKDNEVPIILPFRLPPPKYNDNDVPWCLKKGCNLPDLLGNIHLGE